MSNITPYAIFDISGFDVGLTEDIAHFIELTQKYDPLTSIDFVVQNFQPVKTASIIDKIIRQIKVNYKKGTEITPALINHTTLFLEHFILLTAIEFQIEVVEPEVLCVEYSPRNSTDNLCLIRAQDQFGLNDEISTCFRSYGISSYEEILQDNLLWENAEEVSDEFCVLKAIFKIRNVASRYLLQYQILMNLVMELTKKGSQSGVKDFIINEYNPTVKVEWMKIRTRETRDDRKTGNYTKFEDEITYYRNILAHPPIDIKELNGVDVGATLVELSRHLNSIIIFAVRKKFENKKSQT